MRIAVATTPAAKGSIDICVKEESTNPMTMNTTYVTTTLLTSSLTQFASVVQALNIYLGSSHTYG
jgi:hypothetical protein